MFKGSRYLYISNIFLQKCHIYWLITQKPIETSICFSCIRKGRNISLIFLVQLFVHEAEISRCHWLLKTFNCHTLSPFAGPSRDIIFPSADINTTFLLIFNWKSSLLIYYEAINDCDSPKTQFFSLLWLLNNPVSQSARFLSASVCGCNRKEIQIYFHNFAK